MADLRKGNLPVGCGGGPDRVDAEYPVGTPVPAVATANSRQLDCEYAESARSPEAPLEMTVRAEAS